MRDWCALAVLASFLAVASPARAQPAAQHRLQLAFEPDGLVTLSAQGVTIRDILAEWARQCGCYIVNADKLTGAALSIPIEFAHVPQAQVLESLLRPAAGYVLTPQRAGSTSASRYETIFIVATASAIAAPSASYVPVTYAPPPPVTPGSPDDEIPPVRALPPLRADEPAATPNVPAQQPPAARQPGLPLPGGIMTIPIVPITSVPPPPGPPAGQPSPVPTPNR